MGGVREDGNGKIFGNEGGKSRRWPGTWIQILSLEGRTCMGGGGFMEDDNGKIFLSVKVVNQGDGWDLDPNLAITR